MATRLISAHAVGVIGLSVPPGFAQLAVYAVIKHWPHTANDHDFKI